MSDAPTPITPQGYRPADLSATLGARPRRSATPSTPPPTATDPAPAADPAPPVATGSGNRPDRRRNRASDRATGLPAHTVFYLPAPVGETVRAAARDSRKTHADLIFEAIEATVTSGDLPVLVKDANARLQQPAPTSGGMFTRQAARPRTVSVTPTVQLSARIDAANLKVIDDLVDSLEAGSRSRLVAVALEAHLDPAR